MRFFAILLFSAASLYGQFSSTASHVRPVASLPPTCKVNSGDVVFLTTGTKGVYQCLTTNIWSYTGSGVGTGTVTSVGLVGTANQITVTGSSPITSTGSWTLTLPSGLLLPGTLNKITFTTPATGATFTLADGKTFTISNTLTFSGTDSSSVAFGGGGTVLYNGGALGTPSSGTATNITGLPEGGLSLTDITTNNASTTKHGFAPKYPNDATKYLDGTGAYTVPAGSGSGTVTTTGTMTVDALVTSNATTVIKTPSATATLDSSGNISTPGSITQTGSFSGSLTYNGLTSGAAGFSVNDVAGTAISYILPATNGAANQLLYDTGSATCPTLVSGAPSTCHQLAWTNALTSGRVVIAGSGLLTDDSDLTFATDTLTATKIAAPTSLTVAGAAITNNIVQNSKSADYTTVIGDAGEHIYHPVGDNNARTFTIAANASVAYPIGTAITFINDAAANVTIAITSDTMALAGTGSTGSRTLTQYGVATATKVTSTRWIISGVGLT